MSDSTNFKDLFTTATGYEPFPWQESLYERFAAGKIPEVCDLPTGLGKTSVVAVWLIALAQRPGKLPRRLVYVVNRRTVVDQTTAEVEKLREDLRTAGLEGPLRDLCGIPLNDGEPPLAISTLRGQFADNGEWCADPSRPAVICGTVDMIGSRLLFGGYRIGFKSRPLHAGFLGQDALLVHDESHLEPAFQKLIETIQDEQEKERNQSGNLPWPGLRVMALSATARNGKENGADTKPFELTPEEKNPPEQLPNPPREPLHHVWRRLKAKKQLQLHECKDEKKKLAGQIAELSLAQRESGRAVLIFVRTVDDAANVVRGLTDKKKGTVPADHVETLTGTMRGLERDGLVRKPVFQRFLPEPDRCEDVAPTEGTVYLVCTSAGEVGVNLSADHMVCDLSTFDSMAQRFGRVNRFGNRDDTRIDVVYPAKFGEKGGNADLEKRRERTLALLQQLEGEASPKALGRLPLTERLAAFAPTPTILTATDILFDNWAMTTIRSKMPGRPPVAPYLHGVAEWEPPRTSVAWREEVEIITGDLLDRYPPEDLLDDYPLKPHELLSDTTKRVFAALQTLIAEPKKSIRGEQREAALKRAEKNRSANCWLIDEQGKVTVKTLAELLNGDRKQVVSQRANITVLLPPSVGGLSHSGMLDAQSERADDVSDEWCVDKERTVRRRQRVWDDAPPPPGMALIRTIDTNPNADESASTDEESEAPSPRPRFWHWYALPREAENVTRASVKAILWEDHTKDVVTRTQEIVNALPLPEDLKKAVLLAAQLHDLGKKRELWQRAIGNPVPTISFAKPGRPGSIALPDAPNKRWSRGFRHSYRHEFGSLLDSLDPAGEHATPLHTLSPELQDVVLHLIAAHHGYARPHFPPDAFDYEKHSTRENETVAHEVMRRYARLQRRYGRWGLAYLESLLRAADWAASANPGHRQTQSVGTEENNS